MADDNMPDWLVGGVADRLASVRAIAERTRERMNRTAGQRDRDVIDVRKAPAVPPTPEQAARADYVEGPVHDRDEKGRLTVRGKAWQRQPRFETIEGLSPDQLRALRFYRAEFDKSERSPIKSQLDVGPGGGGGDPAFSAMLRIEQVAFADLTMRRIEASISGEHLPILRAVALDDQDFKAVAVSRFGGREVQRIDARKRTPVVTTAIEPRSGRHRELVRDQFMVAAAMLVTAVAPFTTAVRLPSAHAGATQPVPPVAGAAATPSPVTAVHPAFLDERGHMRPLAEIAAIILANPTDEAA